jgi:hypothetical protein
LGLVEKAHRPAGGLLSCLSSGLQGEGG